MKIFISVSSMTPASDIKRILTRLPAHDWNYLYDGLSAAKKISKTEYMKLKAEITGTAKFDHWFLGSKLHKYEVFRTKSGHAQHGPLPLIVGFTSKTTGRSTYYSIMTDSLSYYRNNDAD